MTNPPAYDLAKKNADEKIEEKVNQTISRLDKRIKYAIEEGEFKIRLSELPMNNGVSYRGLSIERVYSLKTEGFKPVKIVLKEFKSRGFKIKLSKPIEYYPYSYVVPENPQKYYKRELYISWEK